MKHHSNLLLWINIFMAKDGSKFERKTPMKVRGPTNERQQAVVDMFKHAWKAYKEHAWGEDELKPISKRTSSWFNLGLTIVDSLDTIYLMNLQDEFNEARAWVDTKLNFEVDKFNNLFEMTIRIMGGLMSAYQLSGDPMFMEKALDIGNRMMPAFSTQSAIPFSDVNLKAMKGRSPHWTSDSSTAEVATLQLEFRELSRQTGDARYDKAVSKISEIIHGQSKMDGLVPIYISTQTGSFVGSTYTLGARGDSYYEYLLKQWIQSGARLDDSNRDLYLLKDWLEAVRGIKRNLVAKTHPNNYTLVGENLNGRFSPKMDHLVCFLPGNFALGHMYLKDMDYSSVATKEEIDDLMRLAVELTESCYQMYAQMRTGLSPEIIHFFTSDTAETDLHVNAADTHNLLRPETVESLYYMYKITKTKKYQEYGWKIVQAFEKYTRVASGGYTSIDDVTNPERTRPRDKMESFFLAETLKYLYLLFEDDDASESVDLRKFVFNTEAHLLPIYAN